jgi:cell division GTPase FtsZ
MKFKFVGIGAAGNKAALELVNQEICDVNDVVLVNSTNRDMPADFEGSEVIISENNAGCGKERAIAKQYAIETIKTGVFDNLFDGYDSVLVVTSVEGGTGSGSTPVIAEYISKVLNKNIHILAFTGFEEDVRGLENTVEFFQELDFEADVMTIRNSAFMFAAGRNKFKAEKMANDEFVFRCKVLLGIGMIDSTQNIDDTDIFKVVSTTGYKTIEHIEFNNALVDMNEFNKLCKQMLYNTKSVKSDKPGQLRMGVILNIAPESEDALDTSFDIIKSTYGIPYECFQHVQYDGGTQYITLISSGMKLPLEELKGVYERYKAATAAVDKNKDQFFSELNKLKKEDGDESYDMIQTSRSHSAVDKSDFFKKFD